MSNLKNWKRKLNLTIKVWAISPLSQTKLPPLKVRRLANGFSISTRRRNFNGEVKSSLIFWIPTSCKWRCTMTYYKIWSDTSLVTSNRANDINYTECTCLLAIRGNDLHILKHLMQNFKPGIWSFLTFTNVFNRLMKTKTLEIVFRCGSK